MAKLDESTILSIVASELSDADIDENGITNLATPLSYYLGNLNGTEVEGRSQLVSTDVADAVEWLMPQIMKAFTQTNEVVIFDPISKDDEEQAALESQFVYDILMKDNNGFVIIHQFVKDALIQRNGILKVYYEDNTTTKTESYTGLVNEQLWMLASDESVEILEHEAYDEVTEEGNVTYHNVKIKITDRSGKICIDPVPPEQFRINSQHNSIDVSRARFTGQIVHKTASELLKSGYKQEDIDKIAQADYQDTSYRFEKQGETLFIPDSMSKDPSTKILEIAECYMEMDVDGDGIATLQKITVGGSEPPTVMLDVEEVDSTPWITTTAIIMSHKFQGLSIYDRLRQIQDNKTALVRNTMDNIYFQNNQRVACVENQVNTDDLQTSRPGGIVRVRSIDAIVPLVTPALGDAPFRMMDYLDGIRAGRTGVSPDGNATPLPMGEEMGSEGYERMMNAKEELAGLIVRVICETGIKPLCNKIRDLLTKHYDVVQDYKYKGRWVQVNPSSWKPRTKSTVRVGTGTGDHRKQIAAVSQLLTIQSQIVMLPGQMLVNPKKTYNALDMFCKFSGLHGAEDYFIDPDSEEGKQAAQQAAQSQQMEQQKQQQVEMEQLRVQAELAKSATTTANAARLNVELKAEAEAAKHQREVDKARLEAEKASLKDQLDQANLLLKMRDENKKLEIQEEKMHLDAAVKLTDIEARTQTQQDKNMAENQKAVESGESSGEMEEGD